jgi:transcriptional regulator with XRE-family HTH domain
MMDSVENPIRAYRSRQTPRLTLEKLARKIGTTKANLSRIENGLQPVSEDLLGKLHNLGIPAAELRPDLAHLFNVRPKVKSRAAA